VTGGQGELDGRPDNHRTVEDSPSSVAAPTARMAASGGLITAVKWSTPNIPRLLMVKVPPVNSSGASRPVRAWSTRA
jgi:hypothetical protein